MIVLPSPTEKYDPRNEAEMRRSIEQALARLSANVPDVGGASVGGSGTTGKIPIWTGASTLGDSDIDAPNIAYLSDLFTQAMADGRYSLLGHTHTSAEITDFDAAITAFGDARYFQLTDTSLPGPLDIGDVTGIAAAMLRVGGDVRASGEFDGSDFVLVGGSAGGGASAALFSVLDEGVTVASAVTTMNFVGGGVSVSGSAGDVTVSITFDQAAADARYSLLGHTHPASDIVSGVLLRARMPVGTSFYDTDETFSGVKEFSTGPILSNGVPLQGRRGSDNVPVTLLRYDAGTSDISMILGGTIMRWRDTGAGVPMTLTYDGILTVATEVDSGDFVLVGGSSGGGASAALFSVLDEGVLKSSAVSSINFTGAGVTASAVGDAVTVSITFDQAAADARYSLLGHTHSAAQVTDLVATGDGYWLRRFGSGQSVVNLALGGNVNPFIAFNDGTYQAYWQMTGGAMDLYHNGASRINVTAGGLITLSGRVQVASGIESTARIAASVPWWRLSTDGSSPGIARMEFGTDNTGYSFDVAKNVSGSSTPLFRFYDHGEFRPLAGRNWTTSGWGRSIGLGAGAMAIGWNIGSTYSRWGMGASGDSLYLFSTGADDSSPAPLYHFAANPTNGLSFYSASEFLNGLTVPNGYSISGKRVTGGASIPFMRYDSGTDDLSMVLGGSVLRWRDTGSGVPMALASDGGLTLSGSGAAIFMKDRTSGNMFAFYATGNYGIIWSGAGIDAFKIAYGSGAATFASTATATDFILS